MKKFILTSFVLIAVSSIAFSQEWNYVEDFAYGSLPHGIVVTPDGKIWIGYYGITDYLTTPEGEEIPYRPLWIYNSDGTLHRKVQFLTYEGVTDTIFTPCRGLSLDNKGNVLFVEWYRLWRINYRTYQAMNQVIPEPGVSLTEAACDINGFIYVTHVVPNGRPFYIYNKNFQLVGYVDESVETIQRSVVVRPNGKDIFVGRIYGGGEGNGVIHYHSDAGPYGTYEKVGTYQPAIWGQCLDIDFDGRIWVGSYWDVGPDDLNGWYALDPLQEFAIVDQIGENVGMPPYQGPQPPLDGTYYSPRGAAFAPDRVTMYTADFEGGVIKKWQRGFNKPLAQTENVKSITPGEFSLGQNYPNPFNPTTIIDFQLPMDATVVISIYNMEGQKIRSLVNELTSVGVHSVEWNGRDDSGKEVASGVYLYRMKAADYVMSRKLTLIR